MSFFLQRERNIEDLQTILFAFSHKLLECVTTNLSFLKECLSIWSAAMVPWDYSLNDVFWCFNLLSAEHSSLSARVVIWHQCHLQLWQSLLCFCSSNYINFLSCLCIRMKFNIKMERFKGNLKIMLESSFVTYCLNSSYVYLWYCIKPKNHHLVELEKGKKKKEKYICIH